MTSEETLSRCFDRRILLCDETVSDPCVSRLRIGFINLNLLESVRPIRFYIDTRGGDVDEVLRLISTMDTIDAPIIGLVDGRCDMLGMSLLQSCDIRFATRFAEFKFEKISSSTSFRYAGQDHGERHTLYGKHLQQRQEKLDRVIVGKREGAGLRSLRLKEFYEQYAVVCGEDLAGSGFIDEIVDSSGCWAGEDVMLPGKIGFGR